MSCVIHTSASCIIPATEPPFDTEYAKLHIRAIADTEDELIDSWIQAATQYFEEQTGRPIMKATFEYWLDAFPLETKIELPHPPLVDVLAVEYIASDGSLATFTDGASPESDLYQVRTPAGNYARRGWIEPVYGSVWPLARTESGAVRIRYQAGYADTSDQVPSIIKAALLFLVGHFDQFRSEVHFSEGARLETLPFGAEQIMDAFKHSAKSSQVLHLP